jgi:hypothetical protein
LLRFNQVVSGAKLVRMIARSEVKRDGLCDRARGDHLGCMNLPADTHGTPALNDIRDTRTRLSTTMAARDRAMIGGRRACSARGRFCTPAFGASIATVHPEVQQ